MRAFWLKIKGERIPLRHGCETTIGRSPYCSIVLNDDLVSRQHVALRIMQGRLEVTDLGSRNGTLVNGERLEGARQLGVGDQLIIGEHVVDVLGGTENRSRTLQTMNKQTLRLTASPTDDPA